MPLQAAREFPAHSRLRFGEDKLDDLVWIVRDIQPSPGADLDDAAAGAGQERAPPAAHSCVLADPEKWVIQQGHNPQPRLGRWAGLKVSADDVCHASKV